MSERDFSGFVVFRNTDVLHAISVSHRRIRPVHVIYRGGKQALHTHMYTINIRRGLRSPSRHLFAFYVPLHSGPPTWKLSWQGFRKNVSAITTIHVSRYIIKPDDCILVSTLDTTVNSKRITRIHSYIIQIVRRCYLIIIVLLLLTSFYPKTRSGFNTIVCMVF